MWKHITFNKKYSQTDEENRKLEKFLEELRYRTLPETLEEEESKPKPGRLWLDDVRDPKQWLPQMGWMRGRPAEHMQNWKWATTAQEAIDHLEKHDVSEISLDHDLGDEATAGTGYDVLNYIEQRTFLSSNYKPPVIHIHTSNPSAREKMEAAVKSINQIYERKMGR